MAQDKHITTTYYFLSTMFRKKFSYFWVCVGIIYLGS